MKSFKEFEEKMHDEEFARLFSNAETDEKIIKIAAEQGYEITKEDIQNFEMTDEMLESVAGGKGFGWDSDNLTSEEGEVSRNSSFNINISRNTD